MVLRKFPDMVKDTPFSGIFVFPLVRFSDWLIDTFSSLFLILSQDSLLPI